MILTPSKIGEILAENPHREVMDKLRSDSKKLRMHLYGTGLSSHLQLIDGLEKTSLKELRAKYARSNKALFATLGRPIDKVWGAKGGSVYYNLTGARDKEAAYYAGNINGGLSVKKWLKTYWEPHMKDDPGGVIFMEVVADTLAAQREKRPFAYPVYKSINSIYSYEASGPKVEWIIFELSQAESKQYGQGKYYRVVDDAFDMIVRHDSSGATIMQEHTFFNQFGRVPAILNSDIVSPEDDKIRLSIFDDVIAMADEYLLFGSIRLTHKLQLGFPIFWKYQDDCGDCNGSGQLGGEDCKACQGTGKKASVKVSDVMLLRAPESKDDPTIAPNVAGFVSPDKVFHEISTQDLQGLEKAMELTLWGSAEMPQVEGQDGTKTATEIVSDQQPKIDRLNFISDSAEVRHKFILDMMLSLQFTTNVETSVNYGRRYHIEGPDAIWDKYAKARKEGAGIALLDDLLEEYLEAKYGGDPISLAIMQKMKSVEPFIHNTAAEVKMMGVDESDLKAKIYFQEWYGTVNDMQLIDPRMTTDILRKQLYAYAEGKQLPAVVQPILN